MLKISIHSVETLNKMFPHKSGKRFTFLALFVSEYKTNKSKSSGFAFSVHSVSMATMELQQEAALVTS